ncbi:MAG: carboxypeptidase regulatory-like domain-containing protein [Gemmatimonadota bacterium]|nr:carboxypeptidase regulatory-like domain-containing protein [Gemmatimonadota bacterium]
MGESKVVSFEGTYLRASGIVGQVTADEEPQEGITVSLQGRGENRSVTTNATGQFSFEKLRRGDYSVVISGYDTDEMTFDVTSQSVTVAYGETANVPFEGVLLRTAGIRGTVAVEGVGPLSGVTVAIAGEGESDDRTTDANGEYLFEGLPAGDYSVSITGFDDDQYGFPDGTSATVTIELKETGTVPFDGIMLRTAAIEGTVTVGDDDTPLPGVMVTVSGGPRDEDHSTSTNDDGTYMVENLHAGVYSVSISGYDTNEYGFDPTIESVDVGLRETAEVAFQGDLLRTAGVSGRVHVDGMGLEGVTVTMTGAEDRMGMTDADGQYGFSGLAAGDYTLTISGWDEVEYAFNPTMDVSLVLDEVKIGQNFAGKALRTATVMGSVMVEDNPLPGIAVTLIKVVSANSGEILGAMATDDKGGYSFGPLLAGAYQVMIAGYADEHDWGALGTTQTTVVLTDATAEVNFAATIIRTAGVSGMVTVDGEAMGGVMVTLTGDHAGDDNTMMTDADDGTYGFDGLRKGDYTVTITNPDAEAYSFPSTSQEVNLSVGQKQPGVNFAGARLKQASISGQVHAEGTPVEGVMVTLSGDADGEDMTDANGEYNFPGLAGGDYMVTIAGWDADAYEFATSETAVTGLGTDEFKIVDFMGTHTKTASIGGVLFLDEGGPNALMRDDGEPVLDLTYVIAKLKEAGVLPDLATGLPLTLLGPELTSEPTNIMATADGMYEFTGLRAGSYVVNVDVDRYIPNKDFTDSTTVEDLLAGAGYEYTGPSLMNVSVAAAEASMDNNLPFEITLQTIHVGAVMGTPEAPTPTMVGGVQIALYPTAEAADAGAGAIGLAMTGADPEMPNHGVATFHFPRALDLGPGGTGNDHLVFAKVVSAGHADIEVSDNQDIEIQYAAADRVSNALAAVRLVNVQVNFQWWVKSNADARDGNEFLGGWVASNEMESDADGLATYSGRITVAEAIAGAEYEVELMEEQHDTVTGEERWMQSDALMHTHNHLAMPDDNESEDNDLGPVYVTWTTQSLTLGVYREADDVEGFTDYQSELAGGDHRPHAEVGAGMMVELMTRDERNRLRVYDAWDHDCDDDGEKEKPTEERDAKGNFAAGMITFGCLPADEEFTVRFNAGDDRDQMDYGYDEIETFGDDLDDFGVSLGAFGAMSGGQPEVRMCSASDPMNPDATGDDWCATFAYQWETGMVHGTVGSEKDHEVTVEPETGHGAIGDDDETNADGEYSIGGLQDGVYTATAASGDAEFQLLDPAEVEDIALYHNEACWAATNPDPATGDDRPMACAADEVDMGENDDGETTYSYRNAHEENWETGRLGLSIRGYVANDGQDGEDMDGLLRGDEAMAGIEMTLLDDDDDVVATTETEADGFYSFDDLAAGDYTVSAGRASNARVIHAINRHPRTRAWRYVTSKTATAEDYSLTPDEADLAKPYWMRAFLSTGRTMGNGTVAYTEGEGTAAMTDTYYNFALVYTDGELTGSVNNLSGSDGSIDIVLETPSPLDTDRKTDTNTRGNFEFSDLIEAIGYTATIEDVGFAQPCVDADGDPDDDAMQDDPDNPGTDICIPAPDMLTADIEGEDDHESLGTLHVYSTTASAIDSLADGVLVRARMQGTDVATYNDTISWASGWNRAENTETTENASSLGTISWASRSVTFWFGTAGTATNPFIPDDATVKLMVGTTACSGATCNLEANETGDAEIGTAMENTITVTVTAENGYDDHVYSVVVARADPVGNTLAAANIQLDSAGTAGRAAADAGTDAFTFTTYDEATSANLIFGLTVLGDEANENAYCAQRVSVKPTGGNTLDAMADDDDDVCPDTRYNLSAAASPGASYDVTVTSEDGVDKVYNLRVIVGPEDS